MQLKTGQGTIPISIVLAIWSISAVISLPGLAISPILGRLDEIFPHSSHFEIQMLGSLPSLLIIPCILLAGQLSLRRNKIKILYAGLGLFFLSGVLCVFATSMLWLIIISCILGIGAGMVIPLSKGFIADYFVGKYRINQLGISSAISNVTLVLATSLTGWLATINWHLPFLVYTLPGVCIILAGYLRKDPAPATADSDQIEPNIINDAQKVAAGSVFDATEGMNPPISGTQAGFTSATTIGVFAATDKTSFDTQAKNNGIEDKAKNIITNFNLNNIFGEEIEARKLLSIMGIYFFATYAVLPALLNLPFLLQHYGYSSSVSGTMISLFFLAIMLPGLFINRILRSFKSKTMLYSLIMIAIGLTLMFLLRNKIVITLGCLICGFGYGIIQPLVYEKAVLATTPRRSTFGLALVMSVNYLAILLAPFIIAIFSDVLHAGKFGGFAFLLNAVMTILISVWCYYKRNSFAFGIEKEYY